MDKPVRSKNKFLMFLPKPTTAALTFQNPPFSPAKDKRSDINQTKLKTHIRKGFSGQVISIIPVEARRKTKNSSFEAQEPTSPKISCIGQIKHKNKIKKEKQASLPKDLKPEEAKKKPLKIRNMLSSLTPTGRRSDASSGKSTLTDGGPSLSQIKRFASGRDSLATFDWKAQVAPVDGDHEDYYSDEESGGEEREVIIPFSAPILIGGGGGGGGAGGGGGGGGCGRGGGGGGVVVALEPRKEINLWKRRTMAQPRPLQVNTLLRSS